VVVVVLFNNFFRDVACTPCTVPYGPKVATPVLLPQLREFLLESARGAPLEPLDQIRQRLRRQLQTITTPPPATCPPSVTDRLENSRTCVRFAICCADSDAPFETLDTISRALVAATSDLSHLAAGTRHAHERQKGGELMTGGS